MDFSSVDRTYAHARGHFRLVVPEHFNFAFDVLDARAADEARTAVIAGAMMSVP